MRPTRRLSSLTDDARHEPHGSITVERLRRLLALSPLASAELASPAAGDLGDISLPVARQPAWGAARTVHLKYSMAMRRGHTVIGLRDFLRALRHQGSDMAAVRIDAPGEYFLVDLDEDLTCVVGILHVIPRRKGGAPGEVRSS